jgi:nitroreductase
MANNETIKTIMERYSCRSYTGEPLTDEQIKTIAEVAVASPSAVNAQPWQVIIVTNKKLVDEMDQEGLNYFKVNDKATYDRMIERGGKLFYNAPCIVVIAIKPHTELDCGIVSENIALAAYALGLGSVIVGLARAVFDGGNGEKYKKLLKFNDGYQFGMSVLVGAVETARKPHELDLSKVTYID